MGEAITVRAAWGLRHRNLIPAFGGRVRGAPRSRLAAVVARLLGPCLLNPDVARPVVGQLGAAATSFSVPMRIAPGSSLLSLRWAWSDGRRAAANAFATRSETESLPLDVDQRTRAVPSAPRCEADGPRRGTVAPLRLLERWVPGTPREAVATNSAKHQHVPRRGARAYRGCSPPPRLING
jgi:hypothetical protein